MKKHIKSIIETGELFNIEEVLATKTTAAHFVAKPHRTIEWLGGVNYTNLEKVFADIKSLMRENFDEEIHLVVNSYGGATGVGMNFFDVVNSVLKPNLVTIGSGDVDSSGITILLSGHKRFVTKNTTMLLHLAGRTFENGKRFTTFDMDSMVKEDKLKDYQYACVIADRTKKTPEQILDLMARNTILTADEAVNLGIVHGVLK